MEGCNNRGCNNRGQITEARGTSQVYEGMRFPMFQQRKSCKRNRIESRGEQCQ